MLDRSHHLLLHGPPTHQEAEGAAEVSVRKRKGEAKEDRGYGTETKSEDLGERRRGEEQ